MWKEQFSEKSHQSSLHRVNKSCGKVQAVSLTMIAKPLKLNQLLALLKNDAACFHQIPQVLVCVICNKH
jgi:hypothetical protein